MTKPSAYDLWRQANGDSAEYRRLMVEHGLLIPLKPGEKAEPLPCGWPTRSSNPEIVAMYDEEDAS